MNVKDVLNEKYSQCRFDVKINGRIEKCKIVPLNVNGKSLRYDVKTYPLFTLIQEKYSLIDIVNAEFILQQHMNFEEAMKAISLGISVKSEATEEVFTNKSIYSDLFTYDEITGLWSYYIEKDENLGGNSNE